MTARHPRARTQARTRRQLTLEALEAREVPALIAALDPSFATAGVATLANSQFEGVALQANGKIVVGGSSTTTDDFLVARYNPDGTLDTTFDTDGMATIDFGATLDAAFDVALQPDGKIVVVGTNGPDFAIARLNTDGSLDTTFDTDGKQTINFDDGIITGNDRANAVAIQPDGKIVLAGTGRVGNALAARLNADGSLDTTFDTDGKATLSFGGGGLAESANAVAIQSDGKIVLAGESYLLGNIDFIVARLNADGSSDASFDTDGSLRISFAGSPALNSANAVAIQPDGKIVAAGTTGTDFAAVRVNPADGSLDTTFDADGKVTVDFGGTDVANAVVVQPDTKILVVGNSSTDLALARLTAAGALDTSFDADGKVTIDTGSATDRATDAALTPEGRVVIAGRGPTTTGQLVRVIDTVERPRRLSVGGATNGSALVFAPTGTGQYATTPVATLAPFGNTGTDVRTAVGDVNGDGAEDTVLVTGPGTPLRVAVVSGADNSTVLVAPFDPFGGNFTGGGFVTTGDFDNDGRAEFVVTPDRGGGPRVSIYSLLTTGLATRANFLTLNPAFRGGVRAAVGDVNADGVADLAVAAGFSGGPQVTLINGTKALTTDGFAPADRLVGDFFAFDAALRNGAYVAIGDVDGDGFGDLIFGAGPGGAPRLLTVSGQALLTQGAVASIASPLSNFFVAGNDTDRGGVRVAAVDADGDNKADVVVGTGENSVSRVRIYLGKNFGGAEPATFQDLDPYGSAVLADGVFVG